MILIGKRGWKKPTIAISWVIFVLLVFDPKLSIIKDTKLPTENVTNKVMTESRRQDVDKIEKELENMGIDNILPWIFMAAVAFGVFRVATGKSTDGGGSGNSGSGGASSSRGGRKKSSGGESSGRERGSRGDRK